MEADLTTATSQQAAANKHANRLAGCSETTTISKRGQIERSDKKWTTYMKQETVKSLKTKPGKNKETEREEGGNVDQLNEPEEFPETEN